MSTLRKLRLEKNLSLRELSEQTGIDYSTISKIERGERGFNEQNLSVFSDFFKVTADYLLGRSEKVPTKIIEKQIFNSPYKDTKEFKEIIESVDQMTRDQLIMLKGMILAIIGTDRQDKKEIV